MNTISPFAMTILIATIISVVFTIMSALRNRIIFKISFRNSYKRIGTTVLVILGSMVGTALITGSQVINDSYDYTAEVAVEENLGEIDIEIKVEGMDKLPQNSSPILDLVESLKKSDLIDDAALINSKSISVQKATLENNGLLKGQITMLSGDWSTLNNFGSDNSLNTQIREPKAGSILVSSILANSIELSKGDNVNLYVDGKVIEVKVEDIFEPAGVAGFTSSFDTANIIINREDIEIITGYDQNYNQTIIVSNIGGLIPTDYDDSKLIEEAYKIIEDSNVNPETLVITERKQSLISQISENGTDTIFSALSVFGIFAGGLLIINIYIMLAEERKSEMGILRAIAFRRSDLIRAYAYEGLIYSISSALTGTVLGIGVGYLLVTIISKILNDFLSSFGVDAQVFFNITIESLVISFSLGMLITYFTVLIASAYTSVINIVSAIRETEPEEVTPKLWKRILKNIIQAILFLNGLLLFVSAEQVQRSLEDNGQDLIVVDGYMWYFGFVLLVTSGIALVRKIILRYTSKNLHAKINWVMTSISSSLIFAYSIYAVSDSRFKESIQTNPIFMLLVGIGLVISLTFITTYNLDLFIKAITFVLAPLRKSVAVVKIALKYPAQNRSRTGLTLAMYAIIIFIVSFISIYRSSLDLVFSNATAGLLGGYDGLVTVTNRANADTISSIIEDNNNVDKTYRGVSIMAEFPEVDTGVDVDAAQTGGVPTTLSPSGFYQDKLFIANQEFLNGIDLEIDETAEGIDAEDVWNIIESDPSSVVITSKYSFNIPGFPTWKAGDTIKLKYPNSDVVVEKKIIAILNAGLQADLPYGSLYISEKALEKDLGITMNDLPLAQPHILFNFKEDIDVGASTKDVKQELAKVNEFNITVAQETAIVLQAFINQFIYLMQGFLSFGLLVGLAGLAVIMTRSVHERRQQIGMLRSLGFTRGMILASFLLEASLIGLLGIFIGITSGSIGGVQLISTVTEDFENFEVAYPVAEIAILIGVIYVGTLIFAAMPSLKASRLNPVEATNYPE